MLVGPVDTIARRGDRVQLNCSSSLSVTVKWTLTRPSTDGFRTIFEQTSDKKGAILPSFKDRFTVSNVGDGFQNLVIENVSLSDAGLYYCMDDGGFGYSNGQWSKANLIVIGQCLQFIVVNYLNWR